jgi:hemoglobin/transferrin/lactoferrin receptor protein
LLIEAVGDKSNMSLPKFLTFHHAVITFLALSTLAAGDDIQRLADMDLMKLSQIPVVSAARHEQNRAESPRSVSVITAEEIRRRNFRNIPEAVAGLTGVFLQQTNYGGGSPIIRGMVGNRILIMLNGIRLNNGTYRLGPNQYLNSIDINLVDRIEIVRGAGSVLYGSDAFGGVVNVITKSAPDPLMGAEFSGKVHARFGSADASGAGRVDFSGAFKRLGVAGGYTQESFGDLRSSLGTQPYTGYRQWAGDLQLRFALDQNRSIVAGITRLRQLDVPRTDTLRSGTDREYLWTSQGRDFIYVQYSDTNLSRYISSMQITGAYQRPLESLNRISSTDLQTERHHLDVVNTANLTVQFTSVPRPAHVLTYGFEGNSDRITSRRTDVNLRTGLGTVAKGNYPDGGTFSGMSLFLQDEISLNRRLHAVLGTRQDWFHIRAAVQDAPTGPLDIRSAPSAITNSGFLLYDLTRAISFVGGVSQGFRAPNLDDSSVLGGGSGRYELPNANLDPERSVNVEAGIRGKATRFSGSAVYFQDRYQNTIDRAPALFNGKTFVDTNNNGIKDSKELDVYQRRNIGRALVRGVEVEGIVNLTEAWTWTYNTTWTYGIDRSAEAPLSRIPPLNGVSRLTWQPRSAYWMEFACVAAAAQRRLSPGDISDIRIGPAGTAGFAVFHLRAGLNRSALAGLSLAWENIANRQYRLYSSGFDHAGSSVVLGYQKLF